MVGLPDAAAREARERVRAALVNCGFEFPLQRIVVNLAPASLRKAGPGMDLAIAVALLSASGQLEWEELPRLALAGELALDGSTRPIPGALAIAEAARESGAQAVVVPLYLMIAKLNLYDSLLAIILPTAAFAMPVSVLILTGTLRDISEEMYEAMSLDGASATRMLFQLVIPMTKGGISTVVIYSALLVTFFYFLAKLIGHGFGAEPARHPDAMRGARIGEVVGGD